ncbi:MAG: class I SAM-dependent methyltransferase [Syntrophomonadaceae bacterium]|nr:class I SAM-dependent methyltransferase [Syntrophomonadaceae bacterium]
MKSLLSPDYWDREWADFCESNADYVGERSSQGEYWNGRADGFARSTIHSASSSSRTNVVFNFLRSFNILQPGMRILDIGSGPGSFAIPMAALGYHVVAIDPSVKMLDILQANIPGNLPGSIATVEGLWEEIDIQEQGWQDGFDLVFASMCPGIHDKTALEKMLRCSKQWCYMSSFSGSRKFPVHDEILGRLFNRQYSNHFNDIIFPFNILYSLGLQPSITFWNTSNQHSQSTESFKREILYIANNIASISPAMEAVIDGIIAKHSFDGSVQQQISSVVGMIAWSKQAV